jgi:hypothetical protein
MNSHNAESVRLAFVAMLRHCADYLSALPADEVEALLDGELELRLSIAAKKGKRKKKAPPLDAERLKDIAVRLSSMDNRASGEQLLHDVAPTRAALETLARHLDVTVRREDRQDDLVGRIIESTIGFRLSSAAIHGRSGASSREESTPTGTKK